VCGVFWLPSVRGGRRRLFLFVWRCVLSGVHERVTRRILADLRLGVVPWVRPWVGGSFRNVVSGRPYSGVNVWLLSQFVRDGGFSDPRFLTPKQALELGGDFRGESCARVTFAASAPRKWKVGEDEDEVGSYFFMKEYNLLNVQQVRGVDFPELVAPSGVVSEFVGRLGSRVVSGGDKAAYDPGRDVVMMPEFSAFVSRDAFDSVLLHEHVHWSGHSSRLGRKFGVVFGDEDYVFEELVAELGSAMLCAEFGLSSALQHSDYVGVWIRVLEGDERAFFAASRAASAAVSFLRSLADGVGVGVGVGGGEGLVGWLAGGEGKGKVLEQ
jgi:antirestriction protein ArdC